MNGRTNSTESVNVNYGALIPLEAVTQFAIAPRNNAAVLSWTDPVDKIATPGGEMVAEWDHTDIVRKLLSAPTSITDGDLILRSTERNQYQTAGYTDNGLENNTEYYYAAFPVSKWNAIGKLASSSVMPTPATPEYYKTKTLSGRDFSNRYSPIYSIDTANNRMVMFPSAPPNSYEQLMFDENLTLTVLDYAAPSGLNNRISHTSSKFVAFCFTDATRGKTEFDTHTFDISTMTRSNPTVILPQRVKFMDVATSINGSIILSGGSRMDSNNIYSEFVKVAVSIDDNLTVHTLSSPNQDDTATMYAANDNYVIVAGGGNGTWGGSKLTTAYNASLTKVSIASLDVNRHCSIGPNGGGTTLGDGFIFVGGEYSGDYNSTATAYDQNLTRSALGTIDAPTHKTPSNVISYFKSYLCTPAGDYALALNVNYNSYYPYYYDPLYVLNSLPYVALDLDCISCGHIGDMQVYIGIDTDNTENLKMMVFHNV